MRIVELAVTAVLLLILGWLILRGFDKNASQRATAFTIGFILGIGWTLILVFI